MLCVPRRTCRKTICTDVLRTRRCVKSRVRPLRMNQATARLLRVRRPRRAAVADTAGGCDPRIQPRVT